MWPESMKALKSLFSIRIWRRRCGKLYLGADFFSAAASRAARRSHRAMVRSMLVSTWPNVAIMGGEGRARLADGRTDRFESQMLVKGNLVGHG